MPDSAVIERNARQRHSRRVWLSRIASCSPSRFCQDLVGCPTLQKYGLDNAKNIP